MDVFEEIDKIKHQIQDITYIELCDSVKDIDEEKYMRCCENIKDIISEKKYNDLCESFDNFFENKLGFCTCCKANLNFNDKISINILNLKSIDKRCKNIEKLIKIQPFLKNLYEPYEMEICYSPIFSFPNAQGKMDFIECLIKLNQLLGDKKEKRDIVTISIYDFIFRNYEIFDKDNKYENEYKERLNLKKILADKLKDCGPTFKNSCKKFNIEIEKWLSILDE